MWDFMFTVDRKFRLAAYVPHQMLVIHIFNLFLNFLMLDQEKDSRESGSCIWF